MEDYYSILGISLDASQDEIKSRFHYLAFIYHPDRFGDTVHRTKAEEDFKKICGAFDVLSNPGKRSDYDKLRNTTSKDKKINREYVEDLIFQAIKKGSRIDLSNKDLSCLNLSKLFDKSMLYINFTNTNLFRTNLSSNEFNESIFTGANFNQANLQYSIFHYIKKIDGCIFKGGHFHNTRFFLINLSGIDLSDCFFDGAIFYQTDLSRAILENSSFSESSLQEAKLDQANLSYTNFRKANMQGSSLKHATLLNSSFLGTN
jgi:curved DNA-binding protein CbpA